jgi:hypothetical protein
MPTGCWALMPLPMVIEVFRDLVAARIIEPTSKVDALRVLSETGVDFPAYRTLKRRLPVFAKPEFRQALSTACAAHAQVGRASLVLYDVSTLHFETDAGDGFREPGFSKERRLDPQITLGLLTDAAGFPLMVAAFEGNKAETATMVPVINAFKAAHRLTDVTVVADAGMISEANQVALRAAGLSFILGARIPYLPDVVREWRDKHPDEAIPDGLVLTQPWPSTRRRRPAGSRIGSSTTSTATTVPGKPCAASTNKLPKPSVPSTDMPRSSATATSSSRGQRSR